MVHSTLVRGFQILCQSYFSAMQIIIFLLYSLTDLNNKITDSGKIREKQIAEIQNKK